MMLPSLESVLLGLLWFSLPFLISVTLRVIEWTWKRDIPGKGHLVRSIDQMRAWLDSPNGYASLDPVTRFLVDRVAPHFVKWAPILAIGATGWQRKLTSLQSNQIVDYAEPSILLAALSPGPLHCHEPELLRELPLQINPYMPLTYALYGLGQTSGKLDLGLSRTIGVLFLAAASAFIYLTVQELGACRWSANCGALVAFVWGGRCSNSRR